MAVNRDVFFRQATLKICGHLQIEVALSECLKYLKTILPVDSINLSVWEPDISSLRIIARATVLKGEKTDILIHMSPDAKEHMERINSRFMISDWPDAAIINNPETDPITKVLTGQLNEEDSSLLHMPLETVGRSLCSIMVRTQGKNKYTKDQAQMLSLLKEPLSIAMSNVLEHRKVLKLKELLVDDNRYLHRQLLQLSGDQIIGADIGLKNVMKLVGQVAAHDSPVLLLGETGVGKDVIANAIHYSSPRKEGPFITVNCGAIPDNLLDSELFGHEKGAFTGAVAQKRGRFERADYGTIFLDEIGELPPQAQVRLLRVLQNKEIERVGGTTQIPLDIRVLAATNRNLEEMIRRGEFREDLWFRLNVFPISIPPLRERKDDIPALVRYFIEKKSKELKLQTVPQLAIGALDHLKNYDWPGNVREMGNAVERALILSQEDHLAFDQFKKPQQEYGIGISSASSVTVPTLSAVMSHYLTQLLQAAKGKIHGKGGAAELAGIKPSTLRSKLDKLGIEYGRKKESSSAWKDSE